ncbi:MAG: NAD(P)H-binding protein [Bauldia sp.]
MIVVTTPTGAIGSQVVQTLVAQGEAVRVIAREPSRLPEPLRGRVEVVAGSHGDAAVLDRAFAGAEAVFWVVPPDFRTADLMAGYVDFSRPAADAIRRHGVGRVVAISALGRGTPWADRAGPVTAALAMSDLVGARATNFRALTLPGFMENMLMQKAAIRDKGMFFLPYQPTLRVPMCATRDIAAAAVALLVDRTWRGKADAPMLGPEDLTYTEVAAIISEVLGRTIRFQPISIDAYREQMKSFGSSAAMAEGLAAMMDAKNHGLDNGEVRTPQNSSPTTYRAWCEAVLRPAILRPAAA